MAKVKFKKTDRSKIRRMVNHGGFEVEGKIKKHKKLVETTFNTEVEFIEHQQMNTGWIVFCNETHVYKSWAVDNTMGEYESRELGCFFEYHNSKLLEDWKLIPPFGCIQKQRKMPGKPLRYLGKKGFQNIDLQKFSEWWVEEQLHIHDVGIKLSKRYPEFKIPFSKNTFKREGYVFCFGDLNNENIMIEPETNTFNFVDFQPIGWVPNGHYQCLYDSYLLLAFESLTDAPVQMYLDYVNKQLLDRMPMVRPPDQNFSPLSKE